MNLDRDHAPGTLGAIFVLSSVIALLASCTPRGTCANDGSKRCEPVGCPRGATGDAARGCRCEGGRVPLLGGCVETTQADDYCGKAARYSGGECVPLACPGGQQIDANSGICLPTRALRDIAAEHRIVLAEDDTLGCAPGLLLRVASGHAGCVTAEACPRGRRWNGVACAPIPWCAPGEIYDGGRCARIAISGSASDAYTIDVASWLAAAVGPDGGEGSPSFCAPLSAAGAFGSPGDPSVRATVELRFPNNDVTQVNATVRATPVPATAAGERSARSMIDALRAIGGTASAATVITTVRCVITSAAAPVAVPTAGAGRPERADGGT